MKIYTDRPDMLPPGHLPVNSPAEADAVVAFTLKLLRNIPRNKPVLLVARRAPVSLISSISSGLTIKPVSLEALQDALSNGGLNAKHPEMQVNAERRLVSEVGHVKEDAIGSFRTQEVGRQAPPPSVRPQVTIGNLYVSYSPGTDVGKTFLSSNLAAWLADRGKKTVLVDLDMGGSGTWEMIHMREMFGLPHQTIADWDGTEKDLLAMVEKHAHPGIKNLHVLIRGGASEPDRIMAALSMLSREYAVVVDTSNNLDLPYISSVLQCAGKILLIGRLTAKVQTRLSEMYSNARRFTGGKITLVVNRVGMKADERNLHPVDLARQFGFRQHYVVHEDEKARTLSLKKRTLPVFLNTRASGELRNIFAKEFPELAPAEKKSAGFLNLFKRRES
ncbi:MAG: hypothetical protein K6T65_09010 [Peptococcaceae bacterium]|nr:hypothetical protein [Peptococcaceae bacterium]